MHIFICIQVHASRFSLVCVVCARVCMLPRAWFVTTLPTIKERNCSLYLARSWALSSEHEMRCVKLIGKLDNFPIKNYHFIT